jgi:hypothetical protein
MPCNNMVINLINSTHGLLIAMERWKHAAFSKASNGKLICHE